MDWRTVLSGRELDGAFIDGDHSFDAALLDLRNMGEMLRPGGIIWFHDYKTQKEPTLAADAYIKETGWDRFVIPRLQSTNDAGALVVQKPM